jgi:hypothetical protein
MPPPSTLMSTPHLPPLRSPTKAGGQAALTNTFAAPKFTSCTWKGNRDVNDWMRSKEKLEYSRKVKKMRAALKEADWVMLRRDKQLKELQRRQKAEVRPPPSLALPILHRLASPHLASPHHGRVAGQRAVEKEEAKASRSPEKTRKPRTAGDGGSSAARLAPLPVALEAPKVNTHATLSVPAYSDEKVANRDIKFWHGAIPQRSFNDGQIPNP